MSSATPRRSRRARRSLRGRVLRVLAVVVVLALLAGVGVLVVRLVSGGEEEPAAAPPSPTETVEPQVRLGDLDTSVVAVARAPFCDAVDPEAVSTALGGTPTDSREWNDGEATRFSKREKDVAHEYGCLWSSDDVTARAWVFAPPVTVDRAQDVRRAAVRADGCERRTGAAAFGKPTVALVCERKHDAEASFRGLFGDAWLTCTVTGREADDVVVERANAWCVAVLEAATAAA